jgi:hypothetical protein
VCPISPPTYPPAPPTSLPSCKNPLKKLALPCSFRFCSLLQIRGSRILCLPEGLLAPLHLGQVALPLPCDPPLNFCPNLAFFFCQALSPGLHISNVFFSQFETWAFKGTVLPASFLLLHVPSAPYPHQTSCTTIFLFPPP